MKKKNLTVFLRKSYGFSMIEIMVATGLIGIVALGAMNLAGQLNQVQRRSKDFLRRNDLVSALTRHIYSTKGCEDLTGQTIPSTPTAINLPQFTFGGMPGFSEGGTLENIRIDNFRASQDLAASLPRVQIGGNTLVKTSLNIELTLTQDGRTMSHYYNVPVLSLNSGEVRLCSDTKDAAEVCTAMLGTFNAATNSCDVADSCLLKGTYKTLECSPVVASGCSLDHGVAENNPYTSGTSCPAGSTPNQTGIINWNHTVSCGKKCTQTINNTARWFTCLECP